MLTQFKTAYQLSPLEELALFTALRNKLAKNFGTEESQIYDFLILETDLLEILQSVLWLDESQNNSLVPYMKYNALWIATNLTLCSHE